MSGSAAEAETRDADPQAGTRTFPNLRPRPAATLMILDRSGPSPTILFGKRHTRHTFMPGKYVFPGGRLERDDHRMPVANPLDDRIDAALLARTVRPPRTLGRALALAAIRETYEETGMLLGVRQASTPAGPSAGVWRDFFERSILPDLEPVRLIGRAITPPRRVRRYDTRFFAIDRAAVGDVVPGVVGPESEFVETVWVRLNEASDLDLPRVTALMLRELRNRIAAGFASSLPVPFYPRGEGSPVREEL